MTFNSSNAGKYEGLLNTDLVFEALSKGIAVEVAEINTNDWTVLNPSSQLNFADFSVVLQFRAVKRGEHFEKTLHKNKASTAYSEFLNLDPKGNERYRVGTKILLSMYLLSAQLNIMTVFSSLESSIFTKSNL